MNRRRIIPYHPHLKKIARELRNNSTKSEIILWMHLKGRQMKGYDFHRQKPLDQFIVDFYCCELFLAIEIDGYSHSIVKVQIKDSKKAKRLNQLGVSVLRIDDQEIFNDLPNVLLEIEQTIDELEAKKHSTILRILSQ